MIRIAVFGATGRMGTAVLHSAATAGDLEIAGAATEPRHPALGSDVGALIGIDGLNVTVTDDPAAAAAGADVVVDFSLPAALAANLDACLKAGCGLVLGTTGLEVAQQAALRRAAEKIPIVYGRNMSVGVNVFTELARLAARYLGPEWDVEISETHHRYKVDAPSGTALQLGEAIASEYGRKLADIAQYGRHGLTGPRAPGTIGFSSLRAGSVIGDHGVMLASETEIIELQHRALDRATFARGALRAARWCAGRAPGYYGMPDVLGFAGSDAPGAGNA